MEDFIRRRRLKSVKLGVAGGIVFGSYLGMINHLHWLFPGYASLIVEALEQLYPWYTPGFFGSFILFGWGFLDAFFALWLVGTLYNWFTHTGYGCKDWPGANPALKKPCTKKAEKRFESKVSNDEA